MTKTCIFDMARPVQAACKRKPQSIDPTVVKPDSLSEVLETFPLHVSFAGRLDLTAPWGVTVDKGWAVACTVIQGNCRLGVEGRKPAVSAAAGDVFVLSPASDHRLQDQPGSRLVPLQELMASVQSAHPLVLASGGGGSRTTLLGGVFSFEAPGVHPFHSALPPIIHMKKQEAEQVLLLDELVRLIDQELTVARPGGRSVVDRLVQILLVQAVRSHLTRETGECQPWIDSILRSEIGPALALMHRHPERSWTVAELAHQAVMSRSAFSAAFAEVVGKPPMRYLRQRRMQLAGRLLGDPVLGLKEIASRAGYNSVSAFSTAFKRFFGMAPGDYRHCETDADTI